MQFDTTNQFPGAMNPNMQPQGRGTRPRRISLHKIVSKKALIGLLVIVFLASQAAILYFVINPPYLAEQNLKNRIIGEVSKIVAIKNPLETPDMAVVSDVDKLKGENSIQAQVYKDAQNGDYVLVYTNEMIIYRRQASKVVYQGDAPATIANSTQQQISDAVISKARAAGIVATDSTETPQLSVVTDVNALKSQSADFYANVQEGDVLAVFSQAKKIIIYRSATGTIVNFGTVSTAIQ